MQYLPTLPTMRTAFLHALRPLLVVPAWIVVPVLIMAASALALMGWRWWRRMRFVANMDASLRKHRSDWKRLDTTIMWLVGCSGAGKTVAGSNLAAVLDATFVDLDDLFWTDDWGRRAPEEVEAMLKPILDKGRVVIAGNYHEEIGHVMLKRATTIVWVRPTRYRIVKQLLFRTIYRIIMRPCVCGNNTESWTNVCNPRTSLLFKTWRNYTRTEGRYGPLLANPPFGSDHGRRRFIQLCSLADCEALRRIFIARSSSTQPRVPRSIIKISEAMQRWQRRRVRRKRRRGGQTRDSRPRLHKRRGGHRGKQQREAQRAKDKQTRRRDRRRRAEQEDERRNDSTVKA